MDGSIPMPGGIVATYHGIRVPAAPHLGAGMIAAMEDGTYEKHEVQLALAHVPKGARVLELGAGSGVVGAVVARHCAPRAVLSVEANPFLLPHITALWAENGLIPPMTLRHGAVFSSPDAPQTVQFFVRGNFLGSRLTQPDRGSVQPVQVPVLRYDRLKAEFPHDVILMDIEGAELDLLRHADLSGVSLIIAEFHRHLYGRAGMRDCRAALTAQGFFMDADASSAGVHIWRRLA